MTTPQTRAGTTICWPNGPKDPALGQEEVHVWAAPLDADETALGSFAASLSPFESERAARFHFARHRDRFITGRGWLRAVLACYLNTEPKALEFSYGAQGKPALGGVHAESGLRFNLAHSEDLALLAVTRLGSVGVDVERVRAVKDAEHLVARFFSPRETKAFRELPADQKPAAFFNFWTRKEAWLKATGEGIGGSLALVEVSFLSGEPAGLLKTPERPGAKEPWVLHELVPATGFVGALAVAARTLGLHCWSWAHV